MTSLIFSSSTSSSTLRTQGTLGTGSPTRLISLFPFPHPSQWITIECHSDHKDDRCRRRGNTSRSATCSSREDQHSLSQNRFELKDCIECMGLMKIMKKTKMVIWSRWWWWWQVPGLSSIFSENAMPSDAWKVCWRPFGSVNIIIINLNHNDKLFFEEVVRLLSSRQYIWKAWDEVLAFPLRSSQLFPESTTNETRV